MKVDAAFESDTFHYRIALEEDDRREARRGFRGVADEPIRLVGNRWRVELPGVFDHVHPDLHAAAIWYILRPFLGRRLALSFGVSRVFADAMERRFGAAFPNVAPGLQPRRPPGHPRPSLLFSGGMDSAAAALLLPRETAVLFLDRIPYLPDNYAESGLLIDLVEPRAACRAVQRLGRDLYVVRDDHEALWEPYPSWHTEMSSLLPFYMADTLEIEHFDTGDIMAVFMMRGYHDGNVDSWRFHPPAPRERPPDSGVLHRLGERLRPRWFPVLGSRGGWSGPALPPGAPFDAYGLLGLEKASSASGLSEVATARIVARSPLHEKSWSCYFRGEGGYCMRCDKCFKKLLLGRIALDEEVPAELFDHFLRQPHLAAIFRRPYFDWHHIWFYVFQKLRCDHPFVRTLQEQARRGPDLSFLEKWYPGVREATPATYRDEFVANVERAIGIMSSREVAALEGLDLPPLQAPPVGAPASRS